MLGEPLLVRSSSSSFHSGDTNSHDGEEKPQGKEAQSWKATVCREVSSISANLQDAMQWIMEVDDAKTPENLSTSTSMRGDSDVNFWYAGCKTGKQKHNLTGQARISRKEGWVWV